MGIAFKSVKLGPGFAYFPAFSLSMGENIQVNFGATPFKFPKDCYLPLQDPKVLEASQATILLQYMERVVGVLVDEDKVGYFSY